MPVEFAKFAPGERTSIKITCFAGTIVDGKHVGTGEVVNASAHDALFLIGSGRAVRYVAPVAEVDLSKPDSVDTGITKVAVSVPAVVVKDADPKPKGKGKRGSDVG